MMTLRTLFGLLLSLSLLSLASCSEEETTAEPYLRDLGMLTINESGMATQFRPDNGTTLQLTNAFQTQLTAQSLRVLTYYLHRGTGQAQLGRFMQVPVIRPDTFSTDKLRTDPLTLQTLWLSTQYLNARLVVKSAGNGHLFGAHHQSLTQHPDGSRTLHLLLHHDQNNDPQAYQRTLYLSIDLSPYASQLTKGQDSLALTTYDDTGQAQTHKLAY